MDYIVEKRLGDNILSDEYEYFFSFFTDRFETMTDLWNKELDQKFNKKFKPIWVLSAVQNKEFLRYKDNIIVLNKKYCFLS